MPSGPSLLNDSDSVQILPARRLQLDRHVHRDAEVGVDRSLDRVGDDHVLAGLIHEEVNGVGRVVPEQVVGPRTRLAECIHVRASEEVGLHVHLLDRQLACRDPSMDPLVRRIEAPGVSDHADQVGLVGHLRDLLRVGPRVGQRDLHLHVLASAQRSDRLRRVHLRRRAEDDRVDVVAGEHFVELGARVDGSVFRGDFLRLF